MVPTEEFASVKKNLVAQNSGDFGNCTETVLETALCKDNTLCCSEFLRIPRASHGLWKILGALIHGVVSPAPHFSAAKITLRTEIQFLEFLFLESFLSFVELVKDPFWQLFQRHSVRKGFTERGTFAIIKWIYIINVESATRKGYFKSTEIIHGERTDLSGNPF